MAQLDKNYLATFPDQDVFDETYTRLVEQPWKAEDSESPWTPSQRLKNTWCKTIREVGPSEIESLAAAVGLARSAGLSFDESDLVDAYFQYPFPPRVIPDVIALLLVTGASPPPILWQAYFAPNLALNPHPISVWLLLAWYLRNPASSGMAEEVLRQYSVSPRNETEHFLVWQSLLNPLVRSKETSPLLWHQLAEMFNPRTELIRYNAQSSALAYAWQMRWHRANIQASTSLKRSKTFSPMLGQRELADDRFLPVEDLYRPKRSTIQWVNQAKTVGEVWQFYNPLLQWPWEAPKVPRPSSPAFGFALAIAGHPPYSGFTALASDLTLSGLWREHPCYAIFH